MDVERAEGRPGRARTAADAAVVTFSGCARASGSPETAVRLVATVPVVVRGRGGDRRRWMAARKASLKGARALGRLWAETAGVLPAVPRCSPPVPAKHAPATIAL